MKGRNSQESGWTKSTLTCVMIEVPQQYNSNMRTKSTNNFFIAIFSLQALIDLFTISNIDVLVTF